MNNQFSSSENLNKQLSMFWIIVPIGLLLIPNVFILSSFDINQIRELYTNSQINWFVLLNLELNRIPGYVWSNITMMGEALIMLPIVFMFVYKNAKACRSIVFSIPVACFLSITLKKITSIPRPAAILDHSEFVIIGKTLMGNTALPSGHTITIFAVSVAVLMSIYPSINRKKDKLILSIFLFLTVMISLSRVAVGAHWPLDLFVGAACGWMAGHSGVYLQTRMSDLNEHKVVWNLIFIMLFSVITLTLIFQLNEFHINKAMILVSLICSIALVYKLLFKLITDQ